MSHTVIPDHRDRALKLENVANRLVHHCRIVNVRWKHRLVTFKSVPLQPLVIGSPGGTGG